MSLLGRNNMATHRGEGSYDPGRIFIKRQSVRALFRALSLLQLQGCDGTEINLDSFWMMGFTVLFGFIMLLPVVFSATSWFGIQTNADETTPPTSSSSSQAAGSSSQAASNELAPEPFPLWAGVDAS